MKGRQTSPRAPQGPHAALLVRRAAARKARPCKFSRCRYIGSFTCRGCGAFVCANHCIHKTADGSFPNFTNLVATCSKCYILPRKGTP